MIKLVSTKEYNFQIKVIFFTILGRKRTRSSDQTDLDEWAGFVGQRQRSSRSVRQRQRRPSSRHRHRRGQTSLVAPKKSIRKGELSSYLKAQRKQTLPKAELVLKVRWQLVKELRYHIPSNKSKKMNNRKTTPNDNCIVLTNLIQ